MKKKTNIIKNISIAVLVIIAINWLASSIYTRFDLTEDNQYTLSESTINYLENLEETVRFSVYLDGDLPLAFTKMKREVSDFLNEVKRIGGSKVLIRFIDPLTIGKDPKDQKSNKNALNRLVQYGLKPYTIQEEDENGKLTQRYIIPGIIVSTVDRYVPINLFTEALSNSTEEQIYESISQLEYICLKGLTQLTTVDKKNVAFLTSQGELPLIDCFDATMSLSETYNIDRVTSQQLLDSIDKYDALIVAKPTKDFSNRDKFILDQYLMRDGNLFACIDMVHVDTDTLTKVSETTALYEDLNFTDFLFNIGVRINPEILLDNQCAKIPLNVSQPGMPPRYEAAPWYYYALLRNNTQQPHIIHNKIDLVKTNFANSIDTVAGNGSFQKTILLTSSKYARTIAAPTQVGFGIYSKIPNMDFFNRHDVPVAAIVEGNIESLFSTRSIPENIPESFEKITKSNRNKIVVVADGDIIRNEIEVQNGDSIPKPLYYYKYFKVDNQIYTGNKDFLLNSINYICGDTALIPLRARDVKARLLNKNRIIEEKSYWQMLNIIAPLLLLLVSAIIILLVRKQKYAKNVS